MPRRDIARNAVVVRGAALDGAILDDLRSPRRAAAASHTLEILD